MVKNEDVDLDSITKMWIYALGISGAAGPLLYSFQVLPDGEKFISLLSVAFMIGMAALLVGGLIGFLFGIPRTVQTAGMKTGSDELAPQINANTNLEQISDWLTKIMVGIGLTQISELRESLDNFMVHVKPALGNNSHSGIFGACVLIYFLIGGFLLSFLLTRVHAGKLFLQADVASRIKKAEKKLSEMEQQIQNDATAFSLVQNKINPSLNVVPPTDEELKLSIAKASTMARTQIFFQARAARSENRQDNKEKMLAVIPIFQSLIDSDVNNLYHANHGQLGCALKDQPVPDYKLAIDAFSTAIQRRNASGEKGWQMYEANRALCRIKSDANFQASQRSEPALKKLIQDDLDVAMNSKQEEWLKSIPDIKQWVNLNN